MRSKLFKGLFLLTAFFLIIVLNSKSVERTGEDIQFIQAFSTEWKINTDQDSIHASFDNEIAFISQLQDCVLKEIAHVEIPHKYFGNMRYYHTNRKGFCYDRAVLMEKFLQHYGFDFRHLYLYFDPKGGYPPVTRFFQRGIPSHALFEVKTQKGWMVMGTNANWIGLGKDNQLLDISTLRKKIRDKSLHLKKETTIGNCFWEDKGDRFRYIYGVYSRHGDFFNGSSDTGKASFLEAFHILPDYNISMLLSNF